MMYIISNNKIFLESPTTNLSDCSRYLNELERDALDLSTASHNRSLNDCKFILRKKTQNKISNFY